MTNEGDWYIAIMRGISGIYSGFIAAGSESYRDWKALAQKRGMQVVAEQFGIKDMTLNRVTGFDEQGRRVDEEGDLGKLAKRLQEGEKIDPQVELDRLCAVA